MRLFIALFAFMVTFSSAVQALDREEQYDALLRDSRIVRDLASSDFDVINGPWANSWIIADIKPGAKSGWAVGIERDAAGKVANPPPLKTKASLRTYGELRNVSVLSGNYSGKSEYEWFVSGWWSGNTIMTITPMAMGNGSRPQPERRLESYSPFKKGGTAILGVRENGVGENQFNMVILIPEEWRESVATASEDRWGKATLPNSTFPASEETLRRQNVFQMQSLLAHPNPFVAITAARKISRSDSLDALFVKKTLAQAIGFRQAIFTYMVLEQLQHAKYPRADEEAVEEIGLLVESAIDSETLRWIALGAYAARGGFLIPDETKATPVEKHSLILLKKIQQQQLLLKGDAAEDDYLSYLLEVARVAKK